KATKTKTKPRHLKTSNELSTTIQETVKHYLLKKTPEQIAKIRSLGVTTIYNHLIDWYKAGGNFDYANYVSPHQERTINQALRQIGNIDKLRPIKDSLPKSITYEQIKLV